MAIFDQDNRRPVSDLMRQNPAALAVEERAIRQAAGRIGQMVCGSSGTNGILIQLEDGRDAVLVSAHAFLDERNQLRCADLRDAVYLPNTNLHPGGPFTDFTLRVVPTTGELPLHLENASGNDSSFYRAVDFLIFVLADRISDDILQDGTTRGHLRLATDLPRDGTALLVGLSSSFMNLEVSGYEACAYRNARPEFWHFCASSKGTSSSPLMVLAGTELLLAGMHTRERTSHGGGVVPRPGAIENGNIALSIEVVRDYLDRIGLPARTAPWQASAPTAAPAIDL